METREGGVYGAWIMGIQSERRLIYPWTNRLGGNSTVMGAVAKESAFYSTETWLGSSMLLLGFALGIAVALLWWRRHRKRARRELLASDLVSLLTHDMRAPLKGMLGYIDMLQEAEHIGRRHLDALRQSAHELNRMLESLLEYARSEVNALPLHNAPLVLEDVIDQALAGLRPKLERKRLDLTVALDPALPTVLVGDSERLRQLVANLLDNAIKYTDQGAVALMVSVAARAGSELTIELEVRDTGPGFGVAARRLLFEPFSAAEHHAMGSSGLGLALVKRLVEAMDGDITVEPARRRGAAVGIRLPLRAGDEAPSADVLVGRRIALTEPHLPTRLALSRMLEGFGAQVFATEADTAPAQPQAYDAFIVSASMQERQAAGACVLAIRRPGQSYPRGAYIDAPVLPGVLYRALANLLSEHAEGDFHGRRCLVVDDDPLSLEHSRSVLSGSGWNAWTAADGRNALRILRERHIDTLFVDLHLPDLDPSAVVRAARARGVRTVVALSAESARDQDMDIDAAIVKPLRAVELEATLREAHPSASQELAALASSTLGGDLEELRDALQAHDHVRADAICHRLEGALRTLQAREPTVRLVALREGLRDTSAWQRSYAALANAVAAYLAGAGR